MEGWNPTLGCTAGCTGCRGRGWVPMPMIYRARRDPLTDAVGRTDNPCDRPARCPPNCRPVPKFRPPVEKPPCNINCYREEQAEALRREQCEKYQKCCPCDGGQCLEIENLNPNRQLIIEQQQMPPPEYIFHLRDQPCKSDFIAGFFNPNDNKTPEERERERCDKFWRACGPNLKPYPGRGVITYPPQRLVSMAEESRCCYPSSCADSKYVKPEYVEEQRAALQQQAEEAYEAQRAQEEFNRNQRARMNAACEIPGCPTGRCGCD